MTTEASTESTETTTTTLEASTVTPSTESTETTTISTSETTTEITESPTIPPTESLTETTLPSSPTETTETETKSSPVLPQNNFVSLGGPLLPVKPSPALRPSSEPSFDPLNFQPVSEQERDKRRPVRVHQGVTASTASDNKKPGQDNPLMMIISFVRQKLQYLNIF